MIKTFIRPSIEEASVTLGLPIVVMPEEAAVDLRRRLAAQFGDGTTTTVHWNHLANYAAIQHPDSWEWIAEFATRSRLHFLFAHETDEPAIFQFRSLEQIEQVLGECPGFDFYVCDDEMKFLICQNDHDYLFGAGNAKSWIESLVPRHEEWATSLPEKSH